MERPRIIDCFTVFNEAFMLDLRLKHHWNHVDRFAICEATETFSGNPKPLMIFDFLQANPHYREKVTVKIVDRFEASDAWGREFEQRNALSALYEDANPQDLIVISDVDEIIQPAAFARLRALHEIYEGRLVHFQQLLSYFKLNYVKVAHVPMRRAGEHYWWGPVAYARGSGATPQGARSARIPGSHRHASFVIPDAGWHFSYVGDDSSYQLKLDSFAHFRDAEIDVARRKTVRSIIEERKEPFGRTNEIWAAVEPAELFPSEFLALVAGHPDLFESPVDTLVEVMDRIRSRIDDPP